MQTACAGYFSHQQPIFLPICLHSLMSITTDLQKCWKMDVKHCHMPSLPYVHDNRFTGVWEDGCQTLPHAFTPLCPWQPIYRSVGRWMSHTATCQAGFPPSALLTLLDLREWSVLISSHFSRQSGWEHTCGTVSIVIINQDVTSLVELTFSGMVTAWLGNPSWLCWSLVTEESVCITSCINEIFDRALMTFDRVYMLH